MSFKFEYAKKEDIPEHLRDAEPPVYVEKDGKWVFDGEGHLPEHFVTSLKRTASSERQQRQDAEEKLKAFGSHTPDTIHTLETNMEKLEKQVKIPGKGEDLQGLIKEAVDVAIAPWKKQTEELTKSNEDKDVQIKAKDINDSIRNGAIAAGVQKDMLDEVVLYSRQFIDMTGDGKTQVVRDTPIKGAEKGTEISDYFDRAIDAGKPWFNSSTSGNATGGDDKNRGGQGTKNNPWADKTWNQTEQERIKATDADQAQKLQDEAKAVKVDFNDPAAVHAAAVALTPPAQSRAGMVVSGSPISGGATPAQQSK